MDVNGDGKLDVLSGSYSRMDQDMAGLFQVLWGEGDGKYRKAEALEGTDGEPLVLPQPEGSEDGVLARICTRPTAVDFDGDGDLDLVSGNFGGTFYLVTGEGAGKFSPAATLLLDVKGAPLHVEHHSDPVLFDWDGDGDLDLLSGSASGGAFLARNVGERDAPAYEPFRTLLAQVSMEDRMRQEVSNDDSHIVAPQSSTRIWVDDVNGDGKADLLVGDSVTLITPAEGVELEAARAQYAALMKEQAQAFEAPPENFEQLSEEEQEAFQQRMMERYQAFEEKLAKVVRREMTGFVWAYHRK